MEDKNEGSKNSLKQFVCFHFLKISLKMKTQKDKKMTKKSGKRTTTIM